MKKHFLLAIALILFYVLPIKGAQISVEIMSPELEQQKTQIQEDISLQFAVINECLGNDFLKNSLHVEVYSSYLELPRSIIDKEIVKVVSPKDFAATVGKTRQIFKDLLWSKLPGVGTATSEIISAYLSSKYYDFDVDLLAASSRLAFNSISIPKDPDLGDIHSSLVDRASAAIAQLGEKSGTREKKRFILRSLEVGIGRSCAEFFGGDFRSFVRGVATPPPDKNFSTFLGKIELLRSRIWADIPERPILQDFRSRSDIQIKLEQARILVAKQESSKIEPLLSQIEGLLRADSSKRNYWWLVFFFGLAGIGIFLMQIIVSAIKYGRVKISEKSTASKASQNRKAK